VAFATISDLRTHVGTIDDEDQARALLDQATGLLRTEIGAHVYPRATVTVPFKIRPYEGWVQLPQQPVVSVASVAVDGVTLDTSDYDVVDGGVWLDHVTPDTDSKWATVEVTFTYGYATVPDDLKLACLIVASQMLASLADHGSAATVALQSSTSQLDDWSESRTYATGPGAPSSVDLPATLSKRLRRKYGPGDVAAWS